MRVNWNAVARLRAILWLVTLALCARAGVCAGAGGAYPESGYLSQARYTNAFFGFAINIPPTSKVIPLGAALEESGNYRLLSVEMLNIGRPTDLTITAHKSADVDGKTAAHEVAELLRKKQERAVWGPKVRMMGGHKFYEIAVASSFQNPYMENAYFTAMKGYVVIIRVRSLDDDYVKVLTKAIEKIEFFEPSLAGEMAGNGARPYYGPALPTDLVDAKLADPPSAKIDGGTLEGNIYKNNEIGFAYELPGGWKIDKNGNDKLDNLLLRGEDRTPGDLRMHQFWNACSKVLVRVNDPRKTMVSLLHPMVIVEAFDTACLPELPFPSDRKDAVGAVEFANLFAGLSQMPGIRKADVGDINGRTFIELRGVISFEKEKDPLVRRLSNAAFVMRHKHYLLVWYMLAENDADLRAIREESKVVFGK